MKTMPPIAADTVVALIYRKKAYVVTPAKTK